MNDADQLLLAQTAKPVYTALNSYREKVTKLIEIVSTGQDNLVVDMGWYGPNGPMSWLLPPST